MSGTQQYLRGSVPKGHDLMSIGFDWNRKVPSKTEIGNFDQGVLRAVVDKKVLGLEVAMHDPVFVHVSSTFEQLIHDAFDNHRIQREVSSTSIAVHVLLEVSGEILKDKVQAWLAILF